VGAVGEGGWAQEGVLQADLNEFEASGKKLLFLVALRGVRAA
jgi:hypothetical protein